MEKKFFAAKRGNVFRRKSDGVVMGRFIISSDIEKYEEVVDENPRHRRSMSPRQRFLEMTTQTKKQ